MKYKLLIKNIDFYPWDLIAILFAKQIKRRSKNNFQVSDGGKRVFIFLFQIGNCELCKMHTFLYRIMSELQTTSDFGLFYFREKIFKIIAFLHVCCVNGMIGGFDGKRLFYFSVLWITSLLLIFILYLTIEVNCVRVTLSELIATVWRERF